MAALESVLHEHNAPVSPAAGNFLFVDVGADAEAVNDALLRRGVIVRPMGSFGAPSALRITAGRRTRSPSWPSSSAAVFSKL